MFHVVLVHKHYKPIQNFYRGQNYKNQGDASLSRNFS